MSDALTGIRIIDFGTITSDKINTFTLKKSSVC